MQTKGIMKDFTDEHAQRTGLSFRTQEYPEAISPSSVALESNWVEMRPLNPVCACDT